MARARLTQPERKAKTRRAILAAAARLFALRGIQATSLDDIAAAIGATKGAIYSSFPSKRALIDALLEQHEVPVDFSPLWRTDRSLADRLSELGRSIATLVRTTPRETVLLDLEYRLDWLRSPRRREPMKRHSTAALDEVVQLLDAANRAQGEEPALPPRDLMIVVAVLGSGLIRLSAELPEPLTDAGIETAFRLLAGAGSRARAPNRKGKRPAGS